MVKLPLASRTVVVKASTTDRSTRSERMFAVSGSSSTRRGRATSARSSGSEPEARSSTESPRDSASSARSRSAA